MSDTPQNLVTAEELRLRLLEKEMERMERQRAARTAEQERLTTFAHEFLHGHITDREREMIRRVVASAVEDGKLEALVYSFPSSLCTDHGRAINNADPDWPKTLQGKARELYEIYESRAKPAGYRLKAMIVSFPGGMPGDVGFFINWGGEHT